METRRFRPSPNGAPRRRVRDREATRRRILDAAMRLLARDGFAALGVNAVGREAGVDKMLIYRYFGGLPELVAAAASRAEFWPPPGEAGDASRAADAAEWGKAELLALYRGLRERPMTQEVLRWELVERNELTERLAELRERMGLEALARAGVDPALAEAIDLPAISALLSAGLIYLVLRAKTATAFNGVPLRSRAGAERIERAAATAVEALLDLARRRVAEGTR
jgi:AcrR family transcriptional regulator